MAAETIINMALLNMINDDFSQDNVSLHHRMGND